ncbi:MAG: hypothetical protein U9O78_03025 [Patescibacteria group bacterium]|nr:hypothetical protein [Patescibacteria group bacterium]
MKGVRIIARNEKAEKILKKHLVEKLSFHQRVVLKKFFKTSFDGYRTFVLTIKSPKLNSLVNPKDLSDRIINEFIADGCSKKDFLIEDVL